jgi:hypothetical protein
MAHLGFVSNEGAIPEYRIQLTGTQFELHVVHNAPTVIEADKFSDVTYSIYVPKYVDREVINWSSLVVLNGDNMQLVNYVFPNIDNTIAIASVTAGISPDVTDLKIVDVIESSINNVLTGSVIKIRYRILNGGASQTLNLVATFRGNIAVRKGCAKFKIIGNIDVSQSVALDTIDTATDYADWE